MPLRVVLLGPPASGKGTQAAGLATAKGIAIISTGDILRDAAASGSELGRRAKSLIDRGEFLGDEEMTAIVRARLTRRDAVNGYVLDGFPRTVPQARALDTIVDAQTLMIINLAVPEAELLRRMAMRRVCSRCGATAPPGSIDTGPCERCGGTMTRRADDGDDRVRQRRLEVYATESRPLLDYYGAWPTFRTIDGARSADRVERDVLAGISAMVPAGSERRS